MADFKQLLNRIIEGGDPYDSEFRQSVYQKAKGALVKISESQPDPELYFSTWEPVLQNEIAALESQYGGLGTASFNEPEPAIAASVENYEHTDEAQQSTSFATEARVEEQIGSLLPEDPILASAPTESTVTNNLEEKPKTGNRLGWFVSLLVGLGLGVLFTYLWNGGMLGNANSTTDGIRISVGQEIDNLAKISSSSGTFSITDDSETQRQHWTERSSKIGNLAAHKVTWALAMEAGAKHRPLIAIEYTGKGAKKLAYIYDIDLAKGIVKGRGAAPKAGKKMKLIDGNWEFEQVLKPGKKHNAVTVRIYPAYAGAKTGTVTAKKVFLSPG